MTPHIATIIAANYLAFARVLATSFLERHPGARVSCLVVDDPDGRLVDGDLEPFEVVPIENLAIDPHELRIMAGIYDVTELSTALKPFLLRSLLAETGGPVVYLDPDIEVHGRLDDLFELSAAHGITVTPHVLRPIPDDDLRPSAADILAAGVYNLGYLGVGPQTLASGFLEFWETQLRRNAISDPSAMLFTDQRWIDFVDCFDHLVLRDPTCNLAYWNAWAHEITEANDQVMVDGQPMRFFHYSGFDPAEPWLLTKHWDPPRVRLSENPPLRRLCARYASRLRDAGHLESRRLPYGWGRADGVEIDRTARRLWRQAVLDAERFGWPMPPGPFDPDGGAWFVAWLNEPMSSGRSRYLEARCDERPDLAAAVSEVSEASPDQLDERSAAQYLINAVVPARLSLAPTAEVGGPLPGLNIAGYFRAEAGVGEAGRLLASAAAAAGVPFSMYDTAAIGSSRAHRVSAWGTSGRAYDTNVLCVNADSVRGLRQELGEADFGPERRTAGLWFWETQRLPASMHHAFQFVDEVWGASRFIVESLSRDAPVPVRRITLPVHVPSGMPSLRRDDLGLPDGFVVLFNFSFHSVVQRKNPAAAIQAFRRAFDADDGAHLVIKTVGGQDRWRELEELRLLAADRPDVHVVDGDLRAAEARAMMAMSDCYLSLHRSEGFGLTLAEAMARARPVIATGWSGNLDFMDERTAHLIPFELVPIPDDCSPYAGTGLWAEPDLDAAAAALRQVFEDRAGAQALGQRAREHILATRSLEVAGRSLRTRWEALRPRRIAA